MTQSLTVSQNTIDELKEREDLSKQLLAKQDEHIRYVNFLVIIIINTNLKNS